MSFFRHVYQVLCLGDLNRSNTESNDSLPFKRIDLGDIWLTLISNFYTPLYVELFPQQRDNSTLSKELGYAAIQLRCLGIREVWIRYEIVGIHRLHYF